MLAGPTDDEGDDEYWAFELAEMLYSERTAQHHWVNRLRFQTLELLMRPDVWAAVKALASVLVERHRLNAKQAYRVIQDVLPESMNTGRAAHMGAN